MINGERHPVAYLIVEDSPGTSSLVAGGVDRDLDEVLLLPNAGGGGPEEEGKGDGYSMDDGSVEFLSPAQTQFVMEGGTVYIYYRCYIKYLNP